MNLPHRLYVGTIGEGLFRSLDGGASFRRACEGMFVECHVRAIAVHPHESQTLFMGTEQGLFVSRNGADSWERVESPLNGLQIWSILILPQRPETLVVGTCPSRLFVSSDSGTTWTESNTEWTLTCPRIIHTRVTSLVADPTESATIWAGVEIGGLWRSRDCGRSWQKVGTGLSSQDIHALAIVADANEQHVTMLASTNNDLNRSVDGGETWQPLEAAKTLPLTYFRALMQKCGSPHVIFAGNGDFPPGSEGVVLRSVDAGQTWAVMHMPGRANSTIWNFAVNPADPELIYGSSVSGQIYRSLDGGSNWQKLPREFGEVRALAWTPA